MSLDSFLLSAQYAYSRSSVPVRAFLAFPTRGFNTEKHPPPSFPGASSPDHRSDVGDFQRGGQAKDRVTDRRNPAAGGFSSLK